MVVATERFIISNKFPYYPPLLRGHGRYFTIKCAKRDNNSMTNLKPNMGIKLQPPFPALAKCAVTISRLGFIDAGYSGDWSRVRVISKEVEDLLKVAACMITPLCIFVILSIFDKEPKT